MKKLLIVEPDDILANFHRELFQTNGFEVEVATSANQGLTAAEQGSFDAIFLDLSFPEAELPGLFRAKTASPLILAYSPLTDSARKSPDASFHFLENNSPDAMVTGLRKVLLVKGAKNSFGADERAAWLRSLTEATTETVKAMRAALRRVFKSHDDATALFELFAAAHSLSARAAAIEYEGARRLATAFEALMHELHRAPELVNASSLRTAGQAIDALAILLNEESADNSEALRGAEVFAVEDDEAARNLIGSAMDLVQLKVTSAKDADEALPILAEREFDLLLFDVGLPGLDGFELCTKVRALPAHTQTPVIFITGMATFDNRVQSSLRGGNDFIAKPFDLQELGLKALLWILRPQTELQISIS